MARGSKPHYRQTSYPLSGSGASTPPSILPSSYPPSSGQRIHVPRRPRKILYLLAVFTFLYWYSFRHGLGEPPKRSPLDPYTPPKQTGANRGGGARLVDGVKPLGGSRAANGAEGILAGLGLGKLSKSLRKVEHVFRKDGYVEVRETSTAEHPIYDMMEQARQRFDGLIARQSRTLPEAVMEYKNRYGMLPPKGFDAWWKFVIEKDIKIVDDYDQIFHDILPFHALPPALARQRAASLVESIDFGFTMHITDSDVQLTGKRAAEKRPKMIADLINGFRQALPKGFDATITGSDHDLGSWILGQDQRARAVELVKQRKYFEADELKALEDHKRNPFVGWFEACNADSPANIRPGAENGTEGPRARTFIHQHAATWNFCDNPEIKRLHGALSLDYPGRTPSMLRPLLVLSKFANNNELLQTPIQAYKNLSDVAYDEFPSWDEKTENKLFWRGSSTGGFNRQRPWEDSHRTRLHLGINGEKGKEDDLREKIEDVMMPDGKGGFTVNRFNKQTLRNAYMNVGLTGGPNQCASSDNCEAMDKKIEFADRVDPRRGAMYKYALDVDGNGWSSRFFRLLTSGSTVVKMTIFPEWHSDWLTPWLHYIPLKLDYSDLYDIMAFFVGPIGPDGQVDASKGHDTLAKQIAEAGQQFAKEHWRWEVMQAYMFRLLLEYARVMADDREAESYNPGR